MKRHCFHRCSVEHHFVFTCNLASPLLELDGDTETSGKFDAVTPSGRVVKLSAAASAALRRTGSSAT